MNIIIIVVMHVFHYSAHEPPADIFFSCSHDITNMWVPHESYFSIFYQVWGIPLLRSNNIQYDSNVVYWFVGRTIDVQPHSKRHTWKLHALRTFAEHGFFFTGVAVQEWVKRMYHMHKWQGLFNWFWAAYTSICLYTCVCVCLLHRRIEIPHFYDCRFVVVTLLLSVVCSHNVKWRGNIGIKIHAKPLILPLSASPSIGIKFNSLAVNDKCVWVRVEWMCMCQMLAKSM